MGAGRGFVHGFYDSFSARYPSPTGLYDFAEVQTSGDTFSCRYELMRCNGMHDVTRGH